MDPSRGQCDGVPTVAASDVEKGITLAETKMAAEGVGLAMGVRTRRTQPPTLSVTTRRWEVRTISRGRFPSRRRLR